jgi:hypothetical protein
MDMPQKNPIVVPQVSPITLETLHKKYPDAEEQALAWIQAWADKVSPGTQMPFAKMKCTLADGPCGCPEDAYVFKCAGPYPPVPIEIVMDLILPEDGSPCQVAGVEGQMLLASEAVFQDGHLHEEPFTGPGKVLYVKKTA